MDAAAGFLIEIAGGLVGQQNRGIHHQCTGQGNALLFTTREFAGFVRTAILKPHAFEERFGALLRMSKRFTVYQRGHHHVFDGRKFTQQVVKLEHQANVFVAKTGKLHGRKTENVLIAKKYVAAGRGIKGSQ